MIKKRFSKRRLKRNSEGIVGIGTLIVFIAMVLVAAIAAAVIINAAAQLQQRAQQTTNDTVHDLGIGINIVNVVAHVNTTTQKVDNIFVYFELNPGAEAMNLSSVMVVFQSQGTGSDKLVNLRWNDSIGASPVPDGNHYYIYGQGTTWNGAQIGGLDPDGGYQGAKDRPIMDVSATLVARIVLGTPGIGSLMPAGSSGEIKFVPAGGGSIGLDEFRIPGALDTYAWVTL